MKLLNKVRDGAIGPHLIDHIDVMIVPVGHQFLCVDILSQPCAEQASLQIMGCKGIPGVQTMHETLVYQGGHCVARA